MDNKKYKVYQLQRVNLEVTHDDVTGNDSCTYDAKLNVIAEYMCKNAAYDNDPYMLAEDIWDACNVDCWNRHWEDGDVVNKDHTITYPVKGVFQGYCNSDIIVETEDGLYLAETVGFKKIPTLEEGMYRIMYTYTFIKWNEIRNKEDFNKETFDNVIQMIKEERAQENKN